MNNQRTPSKKARMRYRDGRFVFSYTAQLGDTVSEIAQNLLGSATNVDIIQILNPGMDINDIRPDQEIFILPATPSAVQAFLDQAYECAKTNANIGEEDSLPAIPSTIITEDLIAGRFEGYMP